MGDVLPCLSPTPSILLSLKRGFGGITPRKSLNLYIAVVSVHLGKIITGFIVRNLSLMYTIYFKITHNLVALDVVASLV